MIQDIIDYKDGLSKLLRKLRIEVTKDDRYKQGRVLEIDKVVRRLNWIIDSYEEKNQINLDHFDIHTVAIVKGHNHKSHNWHTFSPSVNYKSDWQRVNEAEADRIEAGEDSNSYEILEGTLYFDEVLSKIHKIRRLSDGEVFSIGDKVDGKFTRNTKIISFKTDTYFPYSKMELETKEGHISLHHAKKIQ